jgi:N-methylhydantoinase A
MTFRLGIDIGGTFTDFLLSDERGSKFVYKVLSTPHDPSIGFFNGIRKISEDKNLEVREFLSKVETIIHGTTITTNAVLTGGGVKTGLITTQGFRDVINMRRGLKERQYDLKYDPPQSLVPRHLVRVVRERVNCVGETVETLEEADIQSAIDYFREKDVKAVAVGLLFSFLNSEHERKIGQILKEHLPGVYISLSCDILPQIRVYERLSTTVLNAAVGPILSDYLQALTSKLLGYEYRGILLIMQSNGGVMAASVAERFAANTLLSGPAGGPTAGRVHAGIHDQSNFITVDMGGTSFDACLVVDNKPVINTEGKVGGHQLALPMINIHTVGAGGGSIAWIDDGGLLQVGPKSAGADPGPICYNRGGEAPTVTDADLLLGYLDPEFFFGGELMLNLELTRQRVQEKIAAPLNLDVIEAAYGIYEIINSTMADALRVVSIEKGYDPREFALIVAGGAGPIHAGMIAKEVDIPLIIVPRESSVFCAAGMLYADLKHDYVRTCTKPLDQINPLDIGHQYEEMGAAAVETLKEEGIPDARIQIEYAADIRYVGQFNEVEVPVSFEGQLETEDIQRMVDEFHRKHDQLYGYALPGADLELINLRLSAYGITEKPVFEKAARVKEKVDTALKGFRDIYLEKHFIRVPVLDGLELAHGHCVGGPCIIEQPTTTILVPNEYALGCDEFNNYVMFNPASTLDEIKEKFDAVEKLHET